MSTSIFYLLQGKTALEIINTLAEFVYREPFRTMKAEDILSIPEEMRVIMLIADFEAEFAINGIFGFLENSSGLYLDETIDAYRYINAGGVVKTLETIRGIMHSYGTSPQTLRGNFDGLEEFQIVSSVDVHGDTLKPMMEQIEAEARKTLYLTKPNDESISDLLITYIDARKDTIYTWSQNYHVELR
jgi:hypothetical protein